MRKVVWTLTGLALLHNLITLARENEEEKQWAWARNIRIMEFPLNIKECVCVCVCYLTHKGCPLFHFGGLFQYEMETCLYLCFPQKAVLMWGT